MVIEPSSILTMVPRVSSAATRLPIARAKSSPNRLRLSMRASPCVYRSNDVPHQYKPQPGREVSPRHQLSADEPSSRPPCPDDGPEPARRTPAMNEATFLDSILEHPEDEVVRLAYADWLLERGDP